MSLITINLGLVSPYGENDKVHLASGRAEFTPLAHGKFNGAFRTVEKVTAAITDGQMRPVELTPGPWKVAVFPVKSAPWPEMHFVLEEGMPEPVNIVDFSPDVVVGTRQIAKGDQGPPGPRGPQGTRGPTGPAGPPVESISDVPGLQAVLDQLTYDSGWRNVHKLLLNGWKVYAFPILVRRVGFMCELRAYLSKVDATENLFLGPLDGFRPGTSTRVVGAAYGSVAPETVAFTQNANGFELALSRMPQNQMMVSMVWFTNDPIPIALPGDPH